MGGSAARCVGHRHGLEVGSEHTCAEQERFLEADPETQSVPPAPRQRATSSRCHVVSAAGFGSLALGGLAVVARSRGAAPSVAGRFPSRAASVVGLSEVSANDIGGHCGDMDTDVEYVLWGDHWGTHIDHIPSADMCCAMCYGTEKCKSWTWIQDAGLAGNPAQCWLNGATPDEKAPKPGYTSGLPPTRAVLDMHMLFSDTQAKIMSKEEKVAHSSCQKIDEDMDYQSGELVQAVPSIFTAEECCDECAAVQQCQAWTWGKDSAEATSNSVCYLKSAAPLDWQRKKSAGIVSGLPGKHKTNPNVTADQLLRSVTVKRNTTMFCFALMLPKSYEEDLLRSHYELGVSLFSCDTAALYSNASIEVAPGVVTRVVPSDLYCELGGEFGTALNTWIFIKVWKKVIDDLFWLHHGWTVKVDPDSVFIPNRLYAVIQDHADAGYINNCKYGLHGPIEVIARKGMAALAADYSNSFDGNTPASCVKELKFGGWGEDMFLDQCLDKVLKVDRHMDERIMCEDHCDCPDWYWCNNSAERVIYHPFKEKGLYRQCLATALEQSPIVPHHFEEDDDNDDEYFGYDDDGDFDFDFEVPKEMDSMAFFRQQK